MARISLAEAQTWLEPTKLIIDTLDEDLLAQVEVQVLSALAPGGFAVNTWTDSTTTPQLVRSIIGELYAAWVYSRQYSEDEGNDNAYAQLLRQTAAANIAGLVSGILVLTDVPTPNVHSDPGYYPSDSSSAQEPTSDDPSLGGPAFSMGQVF